MEVRRISSYSEVRDLSRYHGNHGDKHRRITHDGVALRGKPVEEVKLRSAKRSDEYHERKPVVTGFIRDGLIQEVWQV
jgi:hypothetical protein